MDVKREDAKIRMSQWHVGYNYKTDPLYYAADRIRQKRRESISLAGRALRGQQRDSGPSPTNGDIQ